jgi:CRISPR-associated protein Cas2
MPFIKGIPEVEMLNIIVTYDIRKDNLRKKISDCCLDYGLDRQQYSVFTGLLKPVQIRALSKALDPFVEEGHVLIVQIAADDWNRRIQLGEKITHED